LRPVRAGGGLRYDARMQDSAGAPIFGFNAARPAIAETVIQRVCDSADQPLEQLRDAAYHEIKRLSASSGKEALAELASWRALARGLAGLGPSEQQDKLRELATRYVWDVAGNFDRRVYRLATRLIPPLLAALLNPRSLATLDGLSHFVDARGISQRIGIHGPLELIHALNRQGTVIYVPTHLSNMDSIVFGYALWQAGLPPATYGAGKNLFTNPILSFFMHNLGAYRVDRRIHHALYKDILKAYSCVLIERGYHSLFFPGGTRSRSGAVESKLKLGLMGTGVEGFARTALDGKPRRVFFVPATINYLLTLEAETLIDDFLQEEGKARYIIEDDESTRIARVTAFSHKLLGLEGAVDIRFCAPTDPFGNRVDELGRSFDMRDREVDPVSYVRNHRGDVTLDATRDTEYTRELAQVVCASYARDTVVMPTHLVAAACFSRLQSTHPGQDLFNLLRIKGDVAVGRLELESDIETLRDRARELARNSKLCLAKGVERASGAEMLKMAMRAFAGYHTRRVLRERGGRVMLSDPRLLLYYQNRLSGHGLAFDPLAVRSKVRISERPKADAAPRGLA